VDNLRLKVAVVLQLTTCSGKLFQAFTLRHTNELERQFTVHNSTVQWNFYGRKTYVVKGSDDFENGCIPMHCGELFLWRSNANVSLPNVRGNDLPVCQLLSGLLTGYVFCFLNNICISDARHSKPRHVPTVGCCHLVNLVTLSQNQGHREFPFWNLKIPPLSAKIPENSRYQIMPYMHIYKHKAHR